MWATERLCGGLLVVAFVAGGSLSCVEHALVDSIRPPNFAIPPEEQLAPPTDGAIWRGDTASGSFLFFDRKARGPGDLLTVLVSETAQATQKANTSLERESSIGAKLNSAVGLTDLLQDAAKSFFELLGVDLTTSKSPSGTEVNVVEAAHSSGFEGDGETRREGDFTSVVTCRVVEVLPGGIFHIYGRRELILNHERQLITVEGLVRREDISIHNTVPSSALAQARLTYDGLGVLDDKQRPPLLARVIDWVYPF
jgi:flagellar L-ring protein precursor FlgH